MRPDQRIVTKLPLAELWDEQGTLNGGRVRHIGQSDIKELLRTGPVHFVVADCGMNLRWIPTHERFKFWKDVEPNIAHHDPSTPIHLEKFPNEIGYAASQWCGRAGECVVLLEKHH